MSLTDKIMCYINKYINKWRSHKVLTEALFLVVYVCQFCEKLSSTRLQKLYVYTLKLTVKTLYFLRQSIDINSLELFL